MATETLTKPELALLRKVLTEPVFQHIIGAEEWSLTEEEEISLWKLINKIKEIG